MDKNNDLDIEEVKNLYYSGINVKNVGKILGTSAYFIKKALKINGFVLNRAKGELLECFFKDINTEEKAYFLGLLYADGCISGNQIVLALTAEDGYLIYKLKEIIKSRVKILEIEAKTSIIGGKKFNGKPTTRFAFNSKQMILDLINKGVYPRKTETLEFPTLEQVPLSFMSHFIRGYFDGDGTVGVYGNNQIRVGFSCSKSFGKSLYEFLTKKLKINCKYNKDQRAKCWYVHILNIEGCKIFQEYLYKDATIFMKRKKDIFDSYKRTEYKQLRDSAGRFTN